MRRNLISGRLIDKAGLTAVIRNKKMRVNYPSGDEMFIAYLKNNFYVLQAKVLKSSPSNLEHIDKVPESHNTSKQETLNFGIPDKGPPVQESTSSIEWKRVTKKREKGKTVGRVDVYYYPKPGVRLRSLKEVKNYCDNENINFDPKEFNFSTKRELKNLTDEDLSEELSEEEHSAMVTEIPKSYREAIVSSLKEKWINAMETEISILKDREVWEIAQRPRNKAVIGCRWVYYIKENAEGQILRYKARLVAQGFHQVEGLDYHEHFHFTLVRMFFILLVIREN
ncbi:hypothetical protein AVEN_222262-1 [Araneus ventricosus]|uniref:MBD domain-containing protein n=1 Tax=Araneus ventricosus TaxID=182803 RepID=A0A4Y2LAM7_ARAVE|nr:hypothetical protein AVEN_222262-1 [Araneus ventricosus]